MVGRRVLQKLVGGACDVNKSFSEEDLQVTCLLHQVRAETALMSVGWTDGCSRYIVCDVYSVVPGDRKRYIPCIGYFVPVRELISMAANTMWDQQQKIQKV